MAQNENIFLAKYCAQCFEPLNKNFKGTCPVCGQKTTALNFNKWLRFNSGISEKHKSTLRKVTAMVGAACVIQLAYTVAALLIMLGVIANPLDKLFSKPAAVADSSTVSEILGKWFKPSEEDLKMQRDMDDALKYEDISAYVSAKHPSSQEEIQYYYMIWDKAQEREYYRENQATQQTVPVQPEEPQKNDAPFSVGGIFGISFAAASIIFSLLGIWLVVAVHLELDTSVANLPDYCGNAAVFFTMTANVVSSGLLMAALFCLLSLHIKLSGKSLKRLRIRAKAIEKAKNPISKANEWQCGHCGYINVKTDSECKSCGKYK